MSGPPAAVRPVGGPASRHTVRPILRCHRDIRPILRRCPPAQAQRGRKDHRHASSGARLPRHGNELGDRSAPLADQHLLPALTRRRYSLRDAFSFDTVALVIDDLLWTTRPIAGGGQGGPLFAEPTERAERADCGSPEAERAAAARVPTLVISGDRGAARVRTRGLQDESAASWTCASSSAACGSRARVSAGGRGGSGCGRGSCRRPWRC